MEPSVTAVIYSMAVKQANLALPEINSTLIGAFVLGLIVLGGLIYAIVIFNEFVRVRNETSRAWSDVDVLLKQRHDQIPNLVAACKGYMQYEQQTLTELTQARASYAHAASISEKAAAAGIATGALKTIFATAEKYPELKANQTFLQLQNSISDLEERIADRREFFNSAVATYNTRLRQFPEIFFAGILGFRSGQMYEVDDEARGRVEVAFSRGSNPANPAS